ARRRPASPPDVRSGYARGRTGGGAGRRRKCGEAAFAQQRNHLFRVLADEAQLEPLRIGRHVQLGRIEIDRSLGAERTLLRGDRPAARLIAARAERRAVREGVVIGRGHRGRRRGDLRRLGNTGERRRRGGGGRRRGLGRRSRGRDNGRRRGGLRLLDRLRARL